jgi:uncharacterized protein (TIGR03067 family)
MRWATLLLILSSAALTTGEAPKGKEPEKQKSEDFKALLGEWLLASTADENREHPGNRLLRMSIAAGGRVRFLLDGSQTNSGTFLPAKAAGKLKAVDLKLSSGKVLRGVYALDGDTLVLCFAEEGKPRPDALKPTGTQWSERWERAAVRERPKLNRCIKPPEKSNDS